ncbi:hypothetical protein OG381_27135 [Streptomyces sp. NBC_00490]|uniref:hypothetical protein n=1 Tax=Streptomyces sp. NBC_00490 TaxID=2903657 RepID=UPI002E185A50
MAADLSFFRYETSQRLRTESRAEDILLILTERGLDIPDTARERITTYADLDTLRTCSRKPGPDHVRRGTTTLHT